MAVAGLVEAVADARVELVVVVVLGGVSGLTPALRVGATGGVDTMVTRSSPRSERPRREEFARSTTGGPGPDPTAGRGAGATRADGIRHRSGTPERAATIR
jgi:hypothetical protein